MEINLCFSLIDKMLVFIFAASLIKGAIAQLVEQRTENPCVPGSNPGSTTLKTRKACGSFFCLFLNNATHYLVQFLVLLLAFLTLSVCMKKGTKIYSIIKGRCPHCHEGDFFLSHSYKLKTMGDVYENCSICKRSFSPEPGFYFGALYVSYALGCAFMISILVGIYILNVEMSLFEKCIAVCGPWFLLTPKMHALSKIIWANFFINYKSSDES